jgi:GWxTD domain-containing protein
MYAPWLRVVILLTVLVPLSSADAENVLLPERYKKWLDEEVVYIISGRERDVFLKLQTDRERDIFIEAFWKQRDPTPGTPQNEFKEEHYRRLEYANRFYGRSSPLPGWKTDRGRMYIILGAPKTIEQYDNTNGVFPTEIWFYMGDPDLGLPPGFNLIFFKRNGTGDYILYSPTNDGPKSLIADSMNNYQDDHAAYNALKDLAPNLAPQTLSLISGEHNLPGSESLASDKLIADISALPQKKIDIDYADAILKFKDFVEVEYSANYIASDACVQVMRDGSGAFFVHYSIEPAKITVEEAGGKYEARLQLTGRVSDAAGRTIYQFDKDFPFSLTAAELDDLRAKSISIQDLFPLVPGTYDFNILLKNTLSKEFTGAQKKVTVPGPGGGPQLSPLLLGYGLERKTALAGGERVPFKAGEEQILCQTRKSFSTKDTLVLFFQVYGVPVDLLGSGTLRTTYLNDDVESTSSTVKLSQEAAAAGIIQTQPLRDFAPGYYHVRVSLLDGEGRELSSQKEHFEISFAPAVPRPMVIAKVATAANAEADLFATGLQCLNKGDLPEARVRLEGAYRRNPQRLEYAVGFAEVLFRENDYRRVKEVLLPFAGEEEPSADLLSLLGRSCHALNEYGDAAKYYTAYLLRFGTNIDILNFLGTCYFQLGRREEAVKAWEKSLELAPNQEKIKNLLDSLKKK